MARLGEDEAAIALDAGPNEVRMVVHVLKVALELSFMVANEIKTLLVGEGALEWARRKLPARAPRCLEAVALSVLRGALGRLLLGPKVQAASE